MSLETGGPASEIMGDCLGIIKRHAARLGDGLIARSLRRASGDLVSPHSFKVAVVSDEFTALGIEPECDAVFLHPAMWREQLELHRPDMLFVESCWQGLQGEWRGLVTGGGETVVRLARFCRIAGIPTVFWAKEDPVHFDDFLDTARHFDWVFTTDALCVPKYRAALGHGRVDVMTFPVQPLLHNPLRVGRRLPGAMFAGAWYGNFDRRCAAFNELAGGLKQAGAFHIYRRPAPPGMEDYPAVFSDSLCQMVPYKNMAAMYKAYQVGLTINTVVDSPTMFARRAVELLACGTRVFSNRCEALLRLFPDEVEQFDDGAAIAFAAAEAYAGAGDVDAERRKLSGVRAVLSRHTWSHRINQIRSRVFGAAPGMVEVAVLANVGSVDEMGRLLEFIDNQVGVSVKPLVYGAAFFEHDDGSRLLSADEYAGGLQTLLPEDTLVAFWSPSDWYGKRYLHDLAIAAQSYAGDAVGKAVWYRQTTDALELVGEFDGTYATSAPIPLRRAMVRARLLPESVAGALKLGDGGGGVSFPHVALDPFSYVEGGAGRRLPPFLEAQ